MHTVAGGVRFIVRVQPRASRTEVCGVHGEALKVRIGAAPVDGAANDSLVALLSKELGVSRRPVRIVSDESPRNKLVQVDGIDTGPIERLAARGTRP